MSVIERLQILFRDLYERREVVYRLVWQQMVLRYRRTALGYLWTLVNPLLMMSVMVVMFATLFKANLTDFAVFFVAGMIPWNCFNSIVTQSGSAFINNESLIKKIYLPKIIFPLSVALGLFADSVLSSCALFAILALLGSNVSWALLFVPFAYLLLFVFAFGIGLVTSVATVFFRDLQHVILIAMQGLFFLTPVLYRHDALAGKLAWVVGLNPIAPFIELFRHPLYLATWPSVFLVAKATALSLVALACGLAIFLWREKKIVFRL